MHILSIPDFEILLTTQSSVPPFMQRGWFCNISSQNGNVTLLTTH
jgi:hypothetical protein